MIKKTFLDEEVVLMQHLLTKEDIALKDILALGRTVAAKYLVDVHFDSGSEWHERNMANPMNRTFLAERLGQNTQPEEHAGSQSFRVWCEAANKAVLGRVFLANYGYIDNRSGKPLWNPNASFYGTERVHGRNSSVEVLAVSLADVISARRKIRSPIKSLYEIAAFFGREPKSQQDSRQLEKDFEREPGSRLWSEACQLASKSDEPGFSVRHYPFVHVPIRGVVRDDNGNLLYEQIFMPQSENLTPRTTAVEQASLQFHP